MKDEGRKTTVPVSSLILLFVTPLCQVNVLEGQRLLVQCRGLARALPLPRGDVGEVGVVALRLPLGGLALHAEVAAAGLRPVQRVEAHQFAQLEKIRDAAGLLERL